MRKLIDLDTAIDAVLKESNTDGAYGYMDTKSIVDLLNDLPSAQPEILRCKDCKHHWTYRPMGNMPTETCEFEQTFYDANVDFCSLAERRTE